MAPQCFMQVLHKSDGDTFLDGSQSRARNTRETMHIVSTPPHTVQCPCLTLSNSPFQVLWSHRPNLPETSLQFLLHLERYGVPEKIFSDAVIRASSRAQPPLRRLYCERERFQ